LTLSIPCRTVLEADHRLESGVVLENVMEELPEDRSTRRLFESDWLSLSELELLALILKPGNNEGRALEQAQVVLDAVGSSSNLRQTTCGELCRAGLGAEGAMAVLGAAHLAGHVRKVPLSPYQRFATSLDIFHHFQPVVEGLKRECFWVLPLDGKNRILRIVRISEGSLTFALVHPREVFRPVIQEAAAGVLLVHNHPSGEPSPSFEDVQITKRLAESGKILGVRVLDHVIIGACRYFSFADQGLL